MSPPRTIHSEPVGKKELRVVLDGAVYRGLVIVGGQSREVVTGTDPAEVRTELKRRAGTAQPGYIGWGGAINRFRQFFPNGMASEGYLDREGSYKREARLTLLAAAPLEAAAAGRSRGDALLRPFQRTNLLFPQEAMRVKDLLLGPLGSRFAEAAARFTLAPTNEGLRAMTDLARTHNAATWPILTYLPFLWDPERHMFLKPEVTRSLAERVGHILADVYQSPPDFATYEALLDLAGAIRRHIAELEPEDGIDVQSFIWVAGGGYKDDDGVYP
ncbi:hypothetical protein [Ancylobacter lacus]|uniref:hypothetical protein n=1 Tax=Ancylobacter lacus TaxID=2579970 RepID=UPI001BCE0E69|nr:hypothetical protein [Ancylobacter lacus]MBS7538293.1 hypothetical protein [Ancylobacter lacus]